MLTPLKIILLLALALFIVYRVVVLTAKRRFERKRGWRVWHVGRDSMRYAERIGGRWVEIFIDGEIQMGKAHHVIFFDTPEKWASYPEWAKNRRDEIITRIKSEFRTPDYDYFNA